MRTGTRCASLTQVKIGLTIREARLPARRVGDVDATGDAGNVALYKGAVAHELDRRLVAGMDRLEQRLLEVAVHPVRIGIDNGDDALPGGRIVAELHQQVGDIAVNRGADRRALEIDPRLGQICDSLACCRAGSDGFGPIGLLLLHRG